MDEKTRTKLKEKIEDLLSNLALRYKLSEISFHGDYMASIIVNMRGNIPCKLDIYYSPKRDEFKLVFDRKKHREVATDLHKAWNKSMSAEKEASTFSKYSAFVDGSYYKGNVSYGVVILKDNKLVTEISGIVKDQSLTQSRQVGGELMAATKVKDWCIENSIREITIFYDYEGIRKWVTKEWKARKSFTKAYASTMNNSGLRIHWKKVKSHSGNKWNERADLLARNAIRGE